MERRWYLAYRILTQHEGMVQTATQSFSCHPETFTYISDRFIPT
jgi:hypothetical protein